MKQKITIIVCFLFFNTIRGQELNSLINQADSIYNSTISDLIFPTSNLDSFFSVSIKKNKLPSSNTHQIKLHQITAEQFKQDLGLVFKFKTAYNFNDAFDERTATFTKFRMGAELEWEILKNGYLQNQKKAQLEINKASYLEKHTNKDYKKHWRRRFKRTYTYITNKELLVLLQSYLSFEHKYFDFVHKLYTQRLIKKEKLIKVSNQLYKLEQQLRITKEENKILKDSVDKEVLQIKKLPFVKLKTDSILLKNNLHEQSALEKNIVLEHHPVNTINLSVYASQNYNYSLNNTRYFGTIGIRFKAPLRLNKRKSIINTKLKILKAKVYEKEYLQYQKFINQVTLYNEKLKDLQTMYSSWQVLNERIRILQVLKEEFTYLKSDFLILELMEEQFEVLENLIKIKKQLYNSLLYLYELHPSNNLKGLLIPYQFKKENTQLKFKLTKDPRFSLAYQLQYILAHENYTVIANDIEVQLFLKKKGIKYAVTARGSSVNTVANLLSNEFKKITK